MNSLPAAVSGWRRSISRRWKANVAPACSLQANCWTSMALPAASIFKRRGPPDGSPGTAWRQPDSKQLMAGNLTFPKNFLWGTATSSTQIEGGVVNEWTDYIAED